MPLTNHDPRTCENSKPCMDCEYPIHSIPSPERMLMRRLATLAQDLMAGWPKDYLPLDGDQTEELSMMFVEELDVINGNINFCFECNQPEDEDGRCGCTNQDAN